jgi:malonyl CoA-acyl carrier protein transacylase
MAENERKVARSMARAFIFPGQGSQDVGMGKALADAFPSAQAVFDEVDAALGQNSLPSCGKVPRKP